MHRNHIEQVDPRDLKNHLSNAKIYGDGADEDLVESIREHDVLQPLLADRQSKLIISGHRRRSGAIQAGVKTVPVIWIDCPDEDEQIELLIESNRNRPKTKEQLAREYKALVEVKQRLAKKRQQAAGGDKTATSTKTTKTPGKESQKRLRENSRKRSATAKEEAAAEVGMSPKTADKAAEVVGEIDQARKSGDEQRAEELTESLNQESVSAAHRKATGKPEPEKGKESQPEKPPAKWINGLIRELGKIEKQVQDLEESGDYPSGAEHFAQHAQEFLTKLGNAKGVLQINKPAGKCTICGGVGRNGSGDCVRCLASGWMTKRQLEIYSDQ